ncbi:MAG TPA: polysaccharide deacetylase family protein [Geothrix sp.]|nr:polysaccharide deacetylase family protein [Geothrix sp.]
MRRPLIGLLALALAGGTFLVLKYRPGHGPVRPAAEAAATLAELTANPAAKGQGDPILEALRSDLHLHRQLILLFADEPNLKGKALAQALEAGHKLHHDRRDLVHELNLALARLATQPPAQRDPEIRALLNWMEGDPELLDLDRLAFRDTLRILQHELTQDKTVAGIALKARLTRDLATVDRLEREVDAEYRKVFGGPGLLAEGGQRDLWNAYVAKLQQLVSVTDLLPHGVEPGPLPGAEADLEKELFGTELPEKVLVLSFDDGPHRLYTEEIKAILVREQVPALFFEVGRNLGSVDAAGQTKLGSQSALTEDLVQSGFVVGNHSYTHAQLNKETGAPLDLEIRETDQLLRAIPGAHSQLFRFPYGARTQVQLQALRTFHLRSVLWNIDSLDWADPVPSSVADRVLKVVAQEKRGIILFHDIHDRAGKVLPVLIPKLRAEGYRFAGLDADGRLRLP